MSMVRSTQKILNEAVPARHLRVAFVFPPLWGLSFPSCEKKGVGHLIHEPASHFA